MATNHGSCHEFAFNNFYSCLGGYASRENRDTKPDTSSVALFVHYWRIIIPHGLLCISPKKLI